MSEKTRLTFMVAVIVVMIGLIVLLVSCVAAAGNNGGVDIDVDRKKPRPTITVTKAPDSVPNSNATVKAPQAPAKPKVDMNKSAKTSKSSSSKR